MEYKCHHGATSFLLPIFIFAILCTSLISDVITLKVPTTQEATKTDSQKIKINDNISWEDYKKIYGKKYSPDDDKEHKKAFEKIKAIVKPHNAIPDKKFTMAINAMADRTKQEKMAHALRVKRQRRSEKQALKRERPKTSKFTMAVNAKTDRTEKEKTALVQLKKRQRNSGNQALKSKRQKTRTKRAPTTYPAEYPTNYDWTEPKNTSIYATPVRDQGETGYCWALATADVLTMQYRRRGGDPEILSPQAIIDCAPKEDDSDESDNEGGSESDVFNYAHEIQGLPTEKTYPLTPEDQIPEMDLDDGLIVVKNECSISEQDKELKRFIQPESIHNPFKEPEKIEEGVKEMLYTHGPVFATILISEELDSFYFYNRGIYTAYHEFNRGKYKVVDKKRQKTCIDVQESDEDSEFHSVIIVGYGTDPTENPGFQDFWRIKNVWGDDWGEDGYMRLGRNQNNLCGIATWALVPLVIPINFQYSLPGALDPARLAGGRLLHVEPAFIEIPSGPYTTTLRFENRSNTHRLLFRMAIVEDNRRDHFKLSASSIVIAPMESINVKVEVVEQVPQAPGPAFKVAEILVNYVKVGGNNVRHEPSVQIIVPIVSDRFRTL